LVKWLRQSNTATKHELKNKKIMYQWNYSPIIKAEILITNGSTIVAKVNINDFENDEMAEQMAQLICDKLN
jgi:hypothetical protein